ARCALRAFVADVVRAIRPAARSAGNSRARWRHYDRPIRTNQAPPGLFNRDKCRGRPHARLEIAWLRSGAANREMRMPRINRRAPVRRSNGLSEQQEMELLIGAGMTAFNTPKERERAWHAHRDELMNLIGPLVRPQGFWDYE